MATHVQDAVPATANSAGSVSISLTGCTNGNVLFLGVAHYQSGLSAFVAGDCAKTAGSGSIGTPVLDGQQTAPPGNSQAGLWRIPITGSGDITLTITKGSGGYWSAYLTEFSGVDATTPDTASGSGSTERYGVTGEVSTDGAGLMVGVYARDCTEDLDINEDSPWIQFGETEDGGAAMTGSGIYRTTTGTTTDAAGWNSEAEPAATPDYWAAVAAAYPGAGAGELAPAPGTGSLQIAGAAPSAETPQKIRYPGSGLLTLTGAAPTRDVQAPTPAMIWIAPTAWDAEPFPLKVSTNGRYLVNQQDQPVLLLAESSQGMLVRLSLTDMETNISTRAAQGFNCLQVHAVAGTTFGNADRSTYDDIDPFTTPGDITTPNATYFARLVDMVDLAAQYGVMVMLDVAETLDSTPLWVDAGVTDCYAWGQYIGNLLKDKPNLIWMVGNDYQPSGSTPPDPGGTYSQSTADALEAVMEGVKSVASQPLFTGWMAYFESDSRVQADIESECTLNFAYTYMAAYYQVEQSRADTPAMPVFLGETFYEEYTVDGQLGTPALIRKQNYWAMLAGACGVTYGTNNWNYPTGWVDDLDLPGALQVAHLKALFEAYSWWLLAPDLDHSVLTAGYGTKSTGGIKDDRPSEASANTYANCARASDGSVILCYLPTRASTYTVTIDMSKITGSNARCRWYDPATGQYTTIGTYSASGTRDFTTVDTDDCLLVIDAA